MDKLVGFWVLLVQFSIGALVMLALQPQLLVGLRGPIAAAGVAMAAGLVGAAAICHPRGAAWFSGVASQLPLTALRGGATYVVAAFGTYRGQGRVLRQAVLISFTLHLLNALSFWLVMRSLTIPASVWFAAIFYPLLSTLLALPVSVSGVGVRDVFAASMFTAFGLSAESGVAFSWLLLGLGIPNALAGGLIQLWELVNRRAAD